jgi:flagellar hook-length control protein FliK
MNISRDKGQPQAIPFEIKTVPLEVTKSNETQGVPFASLLKQEADSFVNKFESPSSYIANKYDAKEIRKESTLNGVEEKEEMKSESEELTDSESVVDDEPLHLEKYPTEFFSFVQSYQELKMDASQDTADLKTEEVLKDSKKALHFSLLKNNEKSSPYAGKSTETTSFIEDAKKLAESIFKKEKRDIKEKEGISPKDAQNREKVDQTGAILPETKEAKVIIHKGNVTFADFSQTRTDVPKNDKIGKGSSLPSSVSAVAKEVVTKEIEPSNLEISKQNQNLEQIDKAVGPNKDSSVKRKSTLHALEDGETKKNLQDPQTLADKSSKNLGVKDREFAKVDQKGFQFADKIKSKDQTEVAINTISNNTSMKEDSSFGQSGGNKNDSQHREGSSFVNSTRVMEHADEISKSEKSNAPSRKEMQKNLDELVKQAKFDIVQNGKSTAEIIMNPKEFGRLTLRVSVDGDKVEGRILVENEEMKELVTNEIFKLRENLKDSGLNLESLLVDVWENPNSSYSQNKSDERKFAEELIHSSYNRNSAVLETEDQSNDLAPLKERSGMIEIFA